MLNTYKKNMQIYQEFIKYVDDNIFSQELKQQINGIMEKYRMCLSCMEKSEVLELIEKCKEYEDGRPLKKHFQEIITGTSGIDEDYNERDYDEDDEYSRD